MPLSFDPAFVEVEGMITGSVFQINSYDLVAGDAGDEIIWWLLLEHATVDMATASQRQGGTDLADFSVETIRVGIGTLFVMRSTRHADVDTLRCELSFSVGSVPFGYAVANFPPGPYFEVASLAVIGGDVVETPGSDPFGLVVVRDGTGSVSIFSTPSGASQTVNPQSTNLSLQVKAYEAGGGGTPSHELTAAADLLWFHALSRRAQRWWAGVAGWT